jgi:hypothetical protein
MILDNPEHAPTLAELMPHSAAFGYGIFDDTPIDKHARIPLADRRERPGDTAARSIEGNIVEKLWGGHSRIFCGITSFRGSV